MFSLLAILMVVGGCWCVDKNAPPYVQSRKDFVHARLALQDLVPHDNNNLTNTDAIVHLSGGILTAVSLAVGKIAALMGSKYDPLSVLQETLPTVFEDYNGVAADPLNEKLALINAKIQPVTALIDVLCPGSDVQTCNAKVEDKIGNSVFLRSRANLLLNVGKVSRTVNLHEKEATDVTTVYGEIPYLIKLMQTKEYEEFAYDLGEVERSLLYMLHK